MIQGQMKRVRYQGSSVESIAEPERNRWVDFSESGPITSLDDVDGSVGQLK